MADAAPGRARLGVLGGSFDPPHLGHLIVASEVCEQLGLERVLFVPAADPPHKEPREETPLVLRLAMTGLATAGDPRFEVSAVEAEEGLRYTADTLAALARRTPGHELVFILGSDSLLQLHTWWHPHDILRLSRLAVVPRPGDAAADVSEAARRWGPDRVGVLDTPPIGISSTFVRERVAAGRSVRYLVPGLVAEFIAEHGLYRRP